MLRNPTPLFFPLQVAQTVVVDEAESDVKYKLLSIDAKIATNAECGSFTECGSCVTTEGTLRELII